MAIHPRNISVAKATPVAMVTFPTIKITVAMVMPIRKFAVRFGFVNIYAAMVAVAKATSFAKETEIVDYFIQCFHFSCPPFFCQSHIRGTSH